MVVRKKFEENVFKAFAEGFRFMIASKGMDQISFLDGVGNGKFGKVYYKS